MLRGCAPSPACGEGRGGGAAAYSAPEFGERFSPPPPARGGGGGGGGGAAASSAPEFGERFPPPAALLRARRPPPQAGEVRTAQCHYFRGRPFGLSPTLDLRL